MLVALALVQVHSQRSVNDPGTKKKRLLVEVLGVARRDECPLTIHVELGASQSQSSSEDTCICTQWLTD